MTNDLVRELRERHIPLDLYCTECGQNWPCDAIRAVDELECVLAENKSLRGNFVSAEQRARDAEALAEKWAVAEGAATNMLIQTQADLLSAKQAERDAEAKLERAYTACFNAAVEWVNVEEDQARIHWHSGNRPNQTTPEDGLRSFINEQRMQRDLATLRGEPAR